MANFRDFKTNFMKIEEIKTGILVFISSIIEDEIDGVKRRKGALGMVDSPVLGAGGLWWWVVHEDGTQIKYRYCEISEMKTIKVSNDEILERRAESEGELISDDIANSKNTNLSNKKDKESDLVQEWIYEVVEKWIN